jgi:hypothetical protein
MSSNSSAPMSLDESRFAVMLAEWSALPVEAPVNVAEWARALADIAAKEAYLRRTGGWIHGPSDYLSVLQLERDEVRHSRLVAWLMDPRARHGLGSGFLRRVLELVFHDLSAAVVNALGNARSMCEVSRDASRIDILVESPGLTLVVESKVDALEHDRQCDTYFELFGSEPGARFIFLTPTGRAPTSARGDSLAAFKRLSFAQVREQLRVALGEGQAAAEGRRVAEDYLRTLEKEFR